MKLSALIFWNLSFAYCGSRDLFFPMKSTIYWLVLTIFSSYWFVILPLSSVMCLDMCFPVSSLSIVCNLLFTVSVTPLISGVWIDIHGINVHVCACACVCVKYNLKRKWENLYPVGQVPHLLLSKIILAFLIFYFFKWRLGWTGQILWEVLLDLHWSYVFIWRELTSPACVDFVPRHLSDSNSNSLSVGSLVFLCGNPIFSKKWQLCLSTFYL